jgi:hypothetical protein
MTEQDYAKLAKRARDAVKDLEEPLKSLAFTRILEQLLAGVPSQAGGSLTGRTPSRNAKGRPLRSSPSEDSVERFLGSALDVSSYVPLLSGKGHLTEKALAVLKVARDELGIEGLQASQIFDILVKKFRVAGVHKGNLHRDLGKALRFVSPLHEDGRVRYILTIAGESHLADVLKELA